MRFAINVAAAVIAISSVVAILGNAGAHYETKQMCEDIAATGIPCAPVPLLFAQ